MGLFDHLFKSPPPEEPAKDQPASGAESRPSGNGAPHSVPPEVTPRQHSPTPLAPPKISPFHAPIGHERGRSSTAYTSPESPASPDAAPPAGGDPEPEIVLELGDILARVPTHCLLAGLHNEHRPLHLRADDIVWDAERIRATVPLTRLLAECPHVFAPTAPGNTPISLPAAKISAQLAALAQRREVSQPPVSPAVKPSEIHLNLATILKRCPAELVIGALPAIDDTTRIALPFDPIAAQLPTGKVEISSARFVAALPRAVAEYFRVREGIRVPLPLQEIFRNLPASASPPMESAGPAPSATVAGEKERAVPEVPPIEREEGGASTEMLTSSRESLISAERESVSNEESISPVEEPVSAAEEANATPEAPSAAGSAAVSGSGGGIPIAPGELPPPKEERPSVDNELPPSHDEAPSLPDDGRSPSDGGDDRANTGGELPSAEDTAADQAGEAEIPLGVAVRPVIRPVMTPPPLLRPKVIEPAPAASASLTQICESLTRVPSVRTCLVFTRSSSSIAGELPEGLTVESLRALAAQLADVLEAAALDSPLPIRQLLLHQESGSIAFFTWRHGCLCALLTTAEFQWGVRDQLAAAATALASSAPL